MQPASVRGGGSLHGNKKLIIRERYVTFDKISLLKNTKKIKRIINHLSFIKIFKKTKTPLRIVKHKPTEKQIALKKQAEKLRYCSLGYFLYMQKIPTKEGFEPKALTTRLSGLCGSLCYNRVSFTNGLNICIRAI